jgi:hypothetical protein
MKTFYIFFLLIFLNCNLSAYADMSQQSSRASDLGMSQTEYAFSMSLAGLLTGTMFGLFLWKSK